MTMSANTTLEEKRAELERALAAGKYQTLIDLLLDKAGSAIRKITRSSRSIPHWYSTTVIGLLLCLTGALLVLLLGEARIMQRGPWLLLFGISCILLSSIGLLLVDMRYRSIFDGLHEYALDTIESDADLADIQSWLAAVGKRRKSLLIALVYAIVTTPLNIGTLSGTAGVFVGFASVCITLTVQFLVGICFYYLLLLVSFHARLRRYRLKLYTADPSSSEIINRLSNMLTGNEYLTAAFTALFTLVVAATGIVALIGLILLAAWLPIILMFALHHYSLTRIITRAKWKTLNDLQAKIERLQAQEDIPSKEALEHIGQLMDYHDRIKNTRNSTLDFRAGLSLVNSLLLPLLAFLLANLDKLRALFQ